MAAVRQASVGIAPDKSLNPDRGCEFVFFYGHDCRTGEPIFMDRDVRRIWNVDALPLVRCRLMGPRWRQHFSVEQRPIEDVRPPWMNECRTGRRWVLTFTLEDDVRELVTTGGWSHERFEEIRPGVFAMWSEVG